MTKGCFGVCFTLKNELNMLMENAYTVADTVCFYASMTIPYSLRKYQIPLLKIINLAFRNKQTAENCAHALLFLLSILHTLD